MDDAERTKLTDLLLFSIFFFFFISLSFGAHQCLEIFEKHKTKTSSPEAPTPWLALMGMKHSSRCLLLRRKMAENAADSTEVSEDASRGRAPPDPPCHPRPAAALSAQQLFPAPPASSCLPCCSGSLHLPPPIPPAIAPFPVGREVFPVPSPAGARGRFPGSCVAVRSGASGERQFGAWRSLPKGTDRLLRQHLGQLPELPAGSPGYRIARGHLRSIRVSAASWGLSGWPGQCRK